MPPIQTAYKIFRSTENRTFARVSSSTASCTAAARARRVCRTSPKDRPERPSSAQDDGSFAQRNALLQTTLDGIEKIDVFVTRIQQAILQAQKTSCKKERALLARRYETLCAGVDLCTQSASHAGMNLINGSGQQQVISFGRNTPSRFVIIHTDLTAGSTGLNLPHASTDFAHEEDMAEALTATHSARQRLEWARTHILQSLQVLRRNTHLHT